MGLSAFLRSVGILDIAGNLKASVVTSNLAKNLDPLIEDLKTLNALLPQVVSVTFGKVRRFRGCAPYFAPKLTIRLFPITLDVFSRGSFRKSHSLKRAIHYFLSHAA